MENTDLQLTPDEQAAVTALRQRVRQDPNFDAVTDDMLVQFMMARKFEEDRAYELMQNSNYRLFSSVSFSSLQFCWIHHALNLSL